MPEQPQTPQIVELSYEQLLMQLDEREQIFVQEYLIDRNATRAAIAFGAEKKSAGVLGWRMLRNVNVSRALAARRKQMANELHLTQEDVVFQLLDVADKSTNGIGGMPDRRAAVAAWELISKMLGFIPDKVQAAANAATGARFQVNIFAPGMLPDAKAQTIENTPIERTGFSQITLNPANLPTQG